MAYALKEHQAQASRRHYEANKLKLKERAAAYTVEQRKILRAYVCEVKNAPCADCGGCYPPFVMDFDHVRGKKRLEIGTMVNRAVSLSTLKTEIAKCELVCANCHRIRTFS